MAQGGYVVIEDRPFVVSRPVDTMIYGRIKRSAGALDLNVRELEFLYWVNVMRKDPKTFHKTYIEAYLAQFPEAISEESQSLAREMAIMEPLPMLVLDKPLTIASGIHASFLARAGRLSHTGESGRDFSARMGDQGIKSCAGEVLFEGKDDMLVGVILLLIDHRVPNLGHRRALLNPAFVKAGVGVRVSGANRVVVVQDLGCE